MIPIRGRFTNLIRKRPPQSLIDSIRKRGILFPINVRKAADGKYEILDGHQRIQAVKIAGRMEVPCCVHILSDEEVREAQGMIGQPSKATPAELGRVALKLKKTTGKTWKQLAEQVGKSPRTLRR
jgi:ParB family chromosome partitioning protein